MNVPAVVPMDLFDTVGGLPTHPLVVHLAVVVLPLAALALLAIIGVPRWRASYGWLTMVGLTVGAAGAVLAAQTGEALAEQVGLPQEHARWGDWLEKAAVGLLAVAIIWFLLQRRAAAGPRTTVRRVLGPPAQATAAILSIVMALGVLVTTVVVGHSGATAVWGDQATATTLALAAPKQAAPAQPPVGSVAPTTPAVSGGTISMSDVRQHATAASCWSVVDSNVYDLTRWIPRHPGGEAVITALCGTDGSAAFHNQHATAKEPNAALAEFKIGALSQ